MNRLELIIGDLLASLLASHALLLQLTGLSRCDLLGLFVLDLVTHGIVGVFLLTGSLVDTRTGALTLNPVVTRGFEMTITHSPDFLAQRLGEVTVVGDNEDTTFEDLEGFNESSK